MKIAKKHSERLADIKDKIKASHDYFIDNVKNFHEFVNFVFNTSLSDNDINKLASLQKPAVEFNILEAMISRLRGEFAKQEPSINVRVADGVPLERMTPDFMATLEVIEGHIREIFLDGANDSLKYRLYTDCLAGGWSVAEVYTDYINETSFEQKIYVQRVFDPTLCGFDPMAREPSKHDGAYCFQLVPKTKDEFEAEFGKDALKDARFQSGKVVGDITEFNWTYKNQDQEIVLVADYYEKKKKRVKICKLTNGHTMQKQDFQRFLEIWEETGVLEQPPQIIEERWTELETIERYRLCGECILEHTVTAYKYFPLVFIDGNSVNIRKSESSASMQMTRPYVYHAKGIQQMKNFSGQTICSEIENMVQSKWKAAVESIPEDYQEAYRNPQTAAVIVYNAFYKDNPEQPLPPPMEVQRMPTPPIVEATFMGSDRVTQTILGSYDSILGVSGNQISGVAIQQGALQSNAAAIPYLMGFINGLNQIAQIIVDLIPKFYVTPRSIPVRGMDGKQTYKVINSQQVPEEEDGQPGKPIMLNYDPNDLEIRVEAGPNSAMQKQVALEQIARMMGTSELFAQFINTKGLETIIDNLDIRGADQLKAAAAEFMKEIQAKQQQAEQMQQEQAGKPDPMVELGNKDIDMRHASAMAKLQIEKERAETERYNDMGKLALEKQKQNMEFHKIMAQIGMEQRNFQREQERQEQERAQVAFDSALAAMQMGAPEEQF